MGLELEAEAILEAALARGGRLAELFLEESSGLSIVMDNGEVEKVIAGQDRGGGIRLISDDLKTFYAHGNEQSTKALLPLARDLAGMAGEGAPQPPQPPSPATPGLLPVVEKPPAEVASARKIEMVRAAEAAARGVDPRIRQVRVSYLDRVQRVRIVNSLGVEAQEERTQVVLAVQCVAEQDGVTQTGYEAIGGLGGLEILEAEDPVKAAVAAAKRAILMLSARPAPGGAMPVVISSSAGGTMIHEAVGHGLEADAVVENMSVYAGRLGEQVASPLISVVDDATLAGRRGSYGFDDEGTPGRRNLLIDKGVLKCYLNDRLSALKMESDLSGNGRRESYRYRPVPRMSNTMILPGEDDPEAILRQTPEGLFVVKMGGGQVNPVNGDFVFEVSEGYLIRDGRLTDPVRGATLTGNGPKVLKEIDRVGNDLGFAIGTCGKDGQGAPVSDAQPTLRIPSLVVGGVQQA